jgi:GT2 family glycosyltransferase
MLKNALDSIPTVGTHIAISSPWSKSELLSNNQFLHESIHRVDQFILQPESGSLGSKINHALDSLPDVCIYMTWIGDDDLLATDCIDSSIEYLDRNPDCVMTFGNCCYIDSEGRTIGTNRSGTFARKTLGLGPQLIPQPGAIWRRSAFDFVGGLNPNLNFAFDLDLFIRLNQIGSIHYIPKTVSYFRWHSNSLSVNHRMNSAIEASKVRRLHYRGFMRVLSPPWELLVIAATWMAGKFLSAVLSSKH